MYASCFEVVYECIMEIKQYLYSGFFYSKQVKQCTTGKQRTGKRKTIQLGQKK